jgi:Ca-activated chloride channel family protein
MRALQNARVAGDEVDRTILLSDGAANRGVRDTDGLRAIAGRMRDRGCAVTTIGLDVDFDEKVMSAIATESNGHHYFVADAADLTHVFDQELDSLLATVARDAELVVEPAPGVEVVEVFDRAFRREGDRIVVPLGTFGARQEKTALMRVHVPADKEGIERVASVSLRWRDLVARSDEAVEGALSLAVASPADAQTDLDPFVGARLERSRTARTLTDANELFRQGKDDEARRTLDKHVAELHAAEAQAHAAAKARPAPKPRALPSLDRDFADQIDAIASAQSSFAQPPPAARGAGGGGGFAAGAPASAPPSVPVQESREGKKAVKDNQAKATQLAF